MAPSSTRWRTASCLILWNTSDADGDPLVRPTIVTRHEKPVTQFKTQTYANGITRRVPVADPGYNLEDKYDPATGRKYKVQVRTQHNAPKGYETIDFGGQKFTMKKGFSTYFNALTDPSLFGKNALGNFVMNAVGLSKHLLLAADTFHLGRLAAWASIIQRRPAAFSKSLVLLDHSADEIRQMVALKEIPKDYADKLIERKRVMNEFIKNGYNISGIVDNYYHDFISSIPITGVFNKWLFQNFQRGAMMEAALREYDRLKPQLGHLNDTELVQRIAKDLNTRFGSLGSQGLFKSKSMQDMARFLILAPQWNEGLIRSEIGSVTKGLPQMVNDSVKNRRIVVGSMVSSMTTMLLAQFAANQIINYATRGHSTLSNPEDNWEAKLSAYIPDLTGTSKGYFLSPLSLPFETAHLLANYLERDGNVHDAARSYLTSRLGGVSRPIYTALAKRDQFDRVIPADKYWSTVAKSAAPVPISASAAVNFGKDVINRQLDPNYTGTRQQFPGQYQKQLMATFGQKSQTVPDEIHNTVKLAQAFLKARGAAPQAEYAEPEYGQLKNFLKIGNSVDATDQMNRLLTTKTPQKIYDSLKNGAAYPFTKNKEVEGEFVKSLTAPQRAEYDAAVAKKSAISMAGRELLAHLVTEPSIKVPVRVGEKSVDFLVTPGQKLGMDTLSSKAYGTVMQQLEPSLAKLPFEAANKIRNSVKLKVNNAVRDSFLTQNISTLKIAKPNAQ
jgi:hypothetical protein